MQPLNRRMNEQPGEVNAFPGCVVSRVFCWCSGVTGERYALRWLLCSRSRSAMVAINAALLGRQLVGVGEPK